MGGIGMNEKELMDILSQCSSDKDSNILSDIKNILRSQHNELKSIRSMLMFFVILTIVSFIIFLVVFSFISLT